MDSTDACATHAKRAAAEWATRIEDWHRLWLDACNATEAGRPWSIGIDDGPDLVSPRDIEAHTARSVKGVDFGAPRPSGTRFTIALPNATPNTCSHDTIVHGLLLGSGRIGGATLAYVAGAELATLEVNANNGALAWFAGVCLDADRAGRAEKDGHDGNEVRPYTIECGYWSAHSCVVEVEARDIEAACRKAVGAAAEHGQWTDAGRNSPYYVAHIGDGHTAPNARADHDVPDEWMEPIVD